MWLRLTVPRPRRAAAAGVAVGAFAALQVLLIGCVGVIGADAARSALARARSGPVAAEISALGPSEPDASTRFLRSSLVLPSSQGPITWTRVVAWNGPVRLPGIAPALLEPGTSLVSPRLRALLQGSENAHLRELVGDRPRLLPPEALAGPEELVIVSVLPRSRYHELRPFERVPSPEADLLAGSGPPVPPRGSTPAAACLLFGALLSTLALARLVALSRASELATLRLLGITPRRVKLVVVLRSFALALIGGVAVAPIALALAATGASIRFLSIDYRLSELVPGPLGVTALVVGAATACAVVSGLGLRRLRLDPLEVRLRYRRAHLRVRAPLLWLGGALLLAGAAFAGRSLRAPDALLLSLEAIGAGAVVFGVIAGMPAAVRAAGRLLRAPLPLFVAGRQLASDPQTSIRGVLAIGGVAFAAGLAAAVGPASLPAASEAHAWPAAIEAHVPDGDVHELGNDLRAEVGENRIGMFSSAGFTEAGRASERRVFMGTCKDLANTGILVTAGRCAAGAAVFVGASPPNLGARLSGSLDRKAESSPLRVSVSGSAPGPDQAWLFLATNRPVQPADTLVVRHDRSPTIAGAVLGAATRSGMAIEVAIPEVDEQGTRQENLVAQRTVNALAAWLMGLAALSSLAAVMLAVLERRGVLTALRYVGLGRATLATSVATTLVTPIVLVAILGCLSGFVLGATFGQVLDGRSPGPPSGVIAALGPITVVSVVLGGGIGSVLAARIRPRPHDAMHA